MEKKEKYILFEGGRYHSLISSFHLFLREEPKAAEGGCLAGLSGALCRDRRRSVADGSPQRTTTTRPFDLRTSRSIRFLTDRTTSLWACLFGTGFIVDPFTSRCLLNSTAICCLTGFLYLAFCRSVLGTLGATLALVTAMTWR